jgi:hypothetical protein
VTGLARIADALSEESARQETPLPRNSPPRHCESWATPVTLTSIRPMRNVRCDFQGRGRLH